MRSNGAQVIHHFSKIVPWGKDTRTNIPFTWSNLQISKSVPGLKKIFSQGRVIDASKIFRSNDRDQVEIPVVLGHKGSARNFTINLRPIAENQCHIKIKEQIPNQASKTILEDAGIIHKDNEPRIPAQDNVFTSHLRREIQYLTGGRSTQEPASTPARDLAIQIAKPNNSIQTGGLTIEGSNEKVRDFLSKPKKEYMSKGGVKIYAKEHTVGKVLSSKKVKKIHVTKNSVGKEVKVLRPQMTNEAEQTIKFKLSNPTKNAADLTVVDKSGKELLSKVKITVNSSVTPSRDHKVARALHDAVLDLAA